MFVHPSDQSQIQSKIPLGVCEQHLLMSLHRVRWKWYRRQTLLHAFHSIIAFQIMLGDDINRHFWTKCFTMFNISLFGHVHCLVHCFLYIIEIELSWDHQAHQTTIVHAYPAKPSKLVVEFLVGFSTLISEWAYHTHKINSNPHQIWHPINFSKLISFRHQTVISTRSAGLKDLSVGRTWSVQPGKDL